MYSDCATVGMVLCYCRPDFFAIVVLIGSVLVEHTDDPAMLGPAIRRFHNVTQDNHVLGG